MRQFVEKKIKTDGYGTISEYVRELIRADQRVDVEGRRIVKERIEARKLAK